MVPDREKVPDPFGVVVVMVVLLPPRWPVVVRVRDRDWAILGSASSENIMRAAIVVATDELIRFRIGTSPQHSFKALRSN